MTTSTRSPRLRLAVFLLAALPAVAAVYWAFSGQLGANPVETLVHHSGLWALRLLLLTLAMTPLQRQLGRAWPVHIRRQLGLWSVFYALIHFSLFLVFDLELRLALLGEEILERPYITVGFSALCLLLPLALTSTRGWQRRLGRRWKALHRLVYPAAALACLHLLWKTKVDEPEAMAYAVILGLLLLLRLPALRRRRRTEMPPGA